MKTNTNLLEIKDVQTPKFKEVKGEDFYQAIIEIYKKVEEKRVIRNQSVSTISKLKNELEALKQQQIMAEDEFEEIEIKKKRKQVQEQLESVDDYSNLDVDAFAKKLISKPEIQKLYEEAKTEYEENIEVAQAYKEKLDRYYKEAISEINRFSAAMGSDSIYRQAAVTFHQYSNN